MSKSVLDAAAGGRAMWSERYTDADHVVYQDMRKSMEEYQGEYENCSPDVMADMRNMPYADGSFDLVVLDPPHVISSDGMHRLSGWIERKYGALQAETWQADIAAAFAECWRVLRIGGVLTMKWADSHRSYDAVLEQLDHPPLFGTLVQNRGNNTRWFTFHKHE